MIATRVHATHTSRRSLAVLLVLCVLLSAGTLGARVLGGPRDAIARTIVVGHLPDALALDPATGHAFVAADGDATVSMLDLASGQLLRTVRVGDPAADAPLALAVDSLTHRVFVANRGDNGLPSVLCVLDSRSGAPLVTRRVGRRPVSWPWIHSPAMPSWRPRATTPSLCSTPAAALSCARRPWAWCL